MGFFSDLKEDLSQAVNELMPIPDVPEEVPGDAGAESAAEEAAAESVSLEEMLKNIDDIQLPQDMEPEPAVEDIPEPEPVPESVEEPEAAAEETAAWEPEAEEPAREPEAAEEPAPEPEPGEEAEAPADMPAAEPEAVPEEPVEEAVPEADVSEAAPEEAADEVPVAWELRREIEQKNGEKESKGAEKKMDSMAGRQASDETAVITVGMEINGDISSEGSIDLVGTVCGNIEILGKLNVTGHINGNSKAAEIYAEGAKINGEIVSEGAVKIGASSVIIGNITATSAAIAGAVKGDIDVKGPVILDASAIVMGNIKSKSVQINNGAVIEGMCSQCYADVSPTSFFDEYKPEIRGSKKTK